MCGQGLRQSMSACMLSLRYPQRLLGKGWRIRVRGSQLTA